MIVYKLIKTPKKYYVFDRNRNKILNISKEDYEELDKLQKKEISENEVGCLPKYQKYGYLKENVIEEILHPETEYIQHYLDHRVQFLILQVTQNCNLRCSYCVYSGEYENRVHSNKVMSWELAKKSIDYLYEHSNELDDVHISFYGGEPLLCLDLIKKCVAYVKEAYPDRNTRYGMTTNGTLLNRKVADFLIKNRFAIAISLDGSKKDHDANRKFANGEGSFDTIVNNIKEIIKYDNEYIKNLRFNTVLNPKSDYGAVRNYFASEDIICDVEVGISLMDSKNYNGDILFSEEFVNLRRYDYFLLLMTMIKKLKKDKLPELMEQFKYGIDLEYSNMGELNSLHRAWHHSGPCMAGAMRMFVNVEGTIYPCEKAVETSEVLMLGKLETGTEADKVAKVMNIGKLSEKDCKNCWGINWCSLCAMYAIKDGKFDLATKKSNCINSLIEAEDKLLTFCFLKEFGYNFGKEEIYV
ncbi:Cys-rich peptide radical SAM maturase CcpM [Clostridium sp. BNL1100]|uniref:Cys-rich peptide radical SAM maturase CcpM n=1 Tax=Clostridium sp. BNL1100 TaxID=755731 RepID=UPI00024A7CDF|nr:Cys-rich peptide radical SAM maturase CcpM [Clostridium sp. BNL1100]AEY66672.1 CLI_3235-class bacteriocin maturation radical SAM enzyme [Clostridium sp. BNL1100]